MLRPSRLPVAIAGLLAIAIPANRSSAQNPAPASTGFATIRGFAFDSIRQVPLARAVIGVEGTSRIAIVDADGNFQVDSVPVGNRRLTVEHPVLDTLGITLVTGSMVMRPGEVLSVDVATPSAEWLVASRCPAAVLQLRGPSAMMGRVIDPDSLKVAVGSKVQLVYQESLLGFKGQPIVREATVDSTGSYRICGLPDKLSGRLQVFKNGVSSGQVDVDVSGPLGLRSLSISQSAIAVSDSLGRSRQVAIGNSRVTGKVLTKAGRPIESARVSVEGTGRVALTNARGEFRLDSVPSGTQSLEVKKIGYASTGEAIELSSRASATATITMDVVELAPVQIISAVQKALDDNGYSERKRQGIGFFIDGTQVHTQAVRFSDAVRTVPHLRVIPAANGRSVIMNSRNPANSCVNTFVDGVRWREMELGDLDDFVQPSEVRAIESYTQNNVPPRFEVPGLSNCATLVVWTNRYIDRAKKK